VHDDRELIERRIERALNQRIKPHLYGERWPLAIGMWTVPGEPVPVAEALKADYRPAAVGDPWGPAWGTTWFRFTGDVPADRPDRSVEAVIDLGFGPDPGFSAEGCAFTPSGAPITGLNPRNRHVPVAAGPVEFYVEAAANPMVNGSFLPTPLGDRGTAGDTPLFRIELAELGARNEDVAALVADMTVLRDLMRQLDPGQPRRWEILRALDRSLDALDFDDVAGSAARAREQLEEVLARPAHASAHHISAVGHAHIDTAWLWPLRETVRKVGRTVANATALAEEDPEFLFVFSQARQHAWVKEHHPELWERLRAAVQRGQVIPVGSQWVEPDGNVPGGEAMVRQIVHGKRFFLDEYGMETEEIWMPDSFGYSAALPQIVKLAGIRWFLTQKISWNQTNKFPHHTFRWEGIDGTRIFTHFPAIDTYNATLLPRELAHAERNYQDKGSGTRSLAPFGHGDGGGGPTREMLATARRVADLEGVPRVTIEPPRAFFEAAEAEYPDAPVWSGELYLEMHRGTLTSQARSKRANRRCEHLLREAELWSTAALVAGVADYPYEELDRLWKQVLTLQFHDILPGSSIRWVHREAEEIYAAVIEDLEKLIDRAQRALAGPEDGGLPVLFNAAPYEHHGTPAMGTSPPIAGASPATVTFDSGRWRLENPRLTVEVDEQGLLVSMVDRTADGDIGREVLAGPANLLQLHEDMPNTFDAWDVDHFYRHKVTDLTTADRIAEDAGSLVVERRFGASHIRQRLSLDPRRPKIEITTEVDWHEREKFLKAAFPLAVHTDRATSEIQFGHLHRPTHTNTSWDAARFETCAHRFVHVAEAGYGVALVDDGIYGHDTTNMPLEGGGTGTTVRLSLLRAALYPDPEADQGHHEFRYALVVGADMADAVREGYALNLPLRQVPGSRQVEPVVTVDNPAVVVEAVKAADDRSGDVVVRLYESLGGRATTRLAPGFAATAVTEVDMLERPLPDGLSVVDGTVDLVLRPFQILTLRFTRDTNTV
jgi:alpha-mannosidase